MNRAWMSINVYVNCPNCDELIDLLDSDDTNGVYHDDCGDVLKQAIPDGKNWTEEHNKFEVNEVCCSACKYVFDVKGMDW